MSKKKSNKQVDMDGTSTTVIKNNLGVLKNAFSREAVYYFEGQFVSASFLNELSTIDLHWSNHSSDEMFDELTKVLEKHKFIGRVPQAEEWYDGNSAVFELHVGLIYGADSPFKEFDNSDSDRLSLILNVFYNRSAVDLVTFGVMPNNFHSGYIDVLNFAVEDSERRTIDAISRGEFDNYQSAFILLGREADGLQRWANRWRAVEDDVAPMFDAVGSEREYLNWLSSGAAAIDKHFKWAIDDELKSDYQKFPDEATANKYLKRIKERQNLKVSMIKRQNVDNATGNRISGEHDGSRKNTGRSHKGFFGRK